MQACTEPTLSIIDPITPVLDLIRREVDAIAEDATKLLTQGAPFDRSTRDGIRAAATALCKIARAAPGLTRQAPMNRLGTRTALAALDSSVSTASLVMRQTLQILGPDDPGAPPDIDGPIDPGTPGNQGGGTVEPDPAAFDTFDDYDAQTQTQASDFYEQNAAQAIDELFLAQQQALRDELANLAQQAGTDAHTAGAAAANNAASNLGAAVGSAVGALVGGPLGAVIGAFVGAAVMSLAHQLVDRMLAAFDDLFTEIFG